MPRQGVTRVSWREEFVQVAMQAGSNRPGAPGIPEQRRRLGFSARAGLPAKMRRGGTAAAAALNEVKGLRAAVVPSLRSGRQEPPRARRPHARQ